MPTRFRQMDPTCHESRGLPGRTAGAANAAAPHKPGANWRLPCSQIEPAQNAPDSLQHFFSELTRASLDVLKCLANLDVLITCADRVECLGAKITNWVR